MTPEAYAEVPPNDRITFLADVKMPAARKADQLLYHCPSKDTGYQSFDRCLIDSIEQFGDEAAVTDYLARVRVALHKLADRGPVGLLQRDKASLRHARQELGGLMQIYGEHAKDVASNIRKMRESHEDKSRDLGDELFVSAMRGATEKDEQGIVGDFQDDYNHYKRMQNYIKHAAAVVGAINRELGIQELPERGK